MFAFFLIHKLIFCPLNYLIVERSEPRVLPKKCTHVHSSGKGRNSSGDLNYGKISHIPAINAKRTNFLFTRSHHGTGLNEKNKIKRTPGGNNKLNVLTTKHEGKIPHEVTNYYAFGWLVGFLLIFNVFVNN